MINTNRPRIGIYAGTFNPVHMGHIAFALQAIEAAQLDMVFFMPERRPRDKPVVEHFAHRVAMLKRAAQPHIRLGVLELVDTAFTVKRSLPTLQQEFPDAQLVFLFGSDVVPSLPNWPHSAQLLRQSELIVGIRSGSTVAHISSIVASWAVPPRRLTMFESYAPTVSSAVVRAALQRRQTVHGLLPSVQRYSNRHWLYVSVA